MIRPNFRPENRIHPLWLQMELRQTPRHLPLRITRFRDPARIVNEGPPSHADFLSRLDASGVSELSADPELFHQQTNTLLSWIEEAMSQ